MEPSDYFRIGQKARRETESFISRHISDENTGWPIRDATEDLIIFHMSTTDEQRKQDLCSNKQTNDLSLSEGKNESEQHSSHYPPPSFRLGLAISKERTIAKPGRRINTSSISCDSHKNVREAIALLTVCAMFLAGCAGREANPVPIYIPGDEGRSCEALAAEITQLQADMTRLLPKTDKFGTNALWAAGGCVLIVPFFFMDFKDAEKVEFEAMCQRHNRLLAYAAENGCDMRGVKAENIPSLESRRKGVERLLSGRGKSDRERNVELKRTSSELHNF